MRIVISDFMSLDGVGQAPGGPDEDTEGGFRHGGWSMPFFDGEAMGTAVNDAMSTTEALLFGRRTWQVMAAAWPSRAGDPFADRMNEIPKYVVSRTLTDSDVTWANSTLLAGDDMAGAVRALKAMEGGDIQVMGSLTLARALIDEGLVDELRLMIEPILLGGGKRVFPESGRACPLELLDATTAKTGVLICRYRPTS